MRVALAQIRSETQPADNLALVADAVASAARQGAHVAVFPEATMCSFARNPAEVAEPFDGPWASAVREIAAQAGVTIVAGMFVAADDGRVHNTLLVTGASSARYDKIHLFDALGYRESTHVAPGQRLVSFDAAGGRIGLSTCYDVRFPTQFIDLARDGAEVMVVAASWAPGPGKTDQWRTLARARAMDSTSYVVAVDQAAHKDPESPGPPTGVGRSLAVSPTGEVLAELCTQPEVAVVELDLARVAAARETIPVLRG